MIRMLAAIGVSLAFTGCSVFQDHQVSTEAPQKLAALTFQTAPVTVRGQIGTAMFPVPGNSGLIVVKTADQKYVFQTAPTRDLAKQGFTRYSVSPGKELVVTGVLAQGSEYVDGLVAARADTIAAADGTVLYRRGN